MRATEDVAELYRSLAERLEQIVRTGVEQAPDAVVEDACQSAWDRLVRHHARVQRETALAWLAQTAVREARRFLGRQGRFTSLEHALELAGDAALGGCSPSAGEVAETHQRLEMVRTLPERQQRVVWLHALGLNYLEIAIQTGCTTRTVDRQLLCARRTLREAAA